MTGGWIGANGRNGWRATATSVDLCRPVRAAQPVTFDAAPAELTVDLAHTAMIVVDMQNDFCHPDGWLASIGVDVSGAERAVDGLLATLPALRTAGVPVIWLSWGNRPDRANLPPGVLHVYDPTGAGVGIGSTVPTGSPVLERDSWAAAIVDELAPPDGDLRIDKYRMSGFWDTELDTVLRNLDVTTVLFGGVNADQCVLATLTDAACAGYDVVMLEDCSATTSPDYCWDATVYNVRQVFGFTALGAELVKAIGA